MNRASNVIPDLTGGGANLSKLKGSTTKESLLGNSVDFLGTGAYATSANHTLPFFCSQWVNINVYSANNQTVGVKYRSDTNNYHFSAAHFNSSTFGLFDYGTVASNLHYRVNNSMIVATGWHHLVWGRSADSTVKMWVDGVPSANNVVTTNPWVDVATGAATERFAVGGRPINTGAISIPPKGNVALTEIYNTEMTDAKVLELYARGASAIQFATDWGHKATGLAAPQSSHVGSGPFIVGRVAGAGTSMKCSMDTINGVPVKTIARNGFSEVASFATSSVGLDAGEAAYGSWSFWAKKPLTGTMIVHIIASIPNAASTGLGYHLQWTSAVNRLVLVETGVGNLIDLNPAPMDPTVWNHYHVTRRYDGLFTLYINGVVAGSATDNTTRASKYMTVYLGTADGCSVALSDIHGGHAFTKYLGVVPPNMG
jgi:hypothetical protein